MASSLDLLIANRSKLLPDERARLAAILRAKARGFRSNPLLDRIRPVVWPKQQMFLALEDREVLFGGSAGGSKTDSLLMAALQYIDVPNYSAILFRRTYTDLSLPGALMHRAQQWLGGTEAHWSAMDKRWTFPSGATLTFGYLENEMDCERYKSAEYQFIGFDELTEHPDGNYRYLFSRLRRVKGMSIPLRMRAATNPGGRHGEWVKDRFVPDEYLNADQETRFAKIWTVHSECPDCSGRSGGCTTCDQTGSVSRKFLPARAQDNLSLDHEEYEKSLANLPFVERARLKNGDWTITEKGGLFFESWFRWYRRSGTHFVLQRPDTAGRDILREKPSVQIFLTVDTASKEKTTSDYTVIAVWGVDRDYNLILLHALREKMEIPKIVPAILGVYAQYEAEFVMIEDAASGTGVIQELRTSRGRGVSVKSYHPGNRDKVSRSTVAQIRCEAGQVYFPAERPAWLEAYLAELLSFPQPGWHDDCVDTLTMAAQHVAGMDSLLRTGGLAMPAQATPPVVGAVGQGGVGGLLRMGSDLKAPTGVVASPSRGSRFKP